MSNVEILSEACLAAFLDHHRDQCRQNGLNSQTTDTDPFSGPKIAADFASEAATRLSRDRLKQLLDFLKKPRSCQDNGERELLKQTLNIKLEEFYSREEQLSGQSRDRLTRPGGPEDAHLGIIMHLQTKEGPVNEFWDNESSTISLLQEKGVKGNFIFGFDWHWRAEKSFKNRRNCPVKEWKPSLVKLHNNFSAAILDLLPLPFIITASGCVKNNFKKMLGKDAVSLELIPSVGSDTLVLDLDFRENKLHRMVLHVHHPVSGFFNAMDRRPNMAAQLDAGLNFFLWLTGRKYSTTSFRQSYSRHGRLEQAPLPDLWAFIKRESDEQRILPIGEYTPSFVIWAGRYIGEDPYTIASQGKSLATTAATKLRQVMRQAACSREQRKRKREKEERWSYLRQPPIDISTTTLNGTLFHGKTVKVTPSGYVSLMLNPERTFVTFRINIDRFKDILSSGKRPTVWFSPTHLTLRMGQKIVYQTPNQRLVQSSDDGLLWFDLISHEIKAISGSLENPSWTKDTISLETDLLADGSWRNQELQRRLLQGDIFHCGKMSNGTDMGRIFFRDVAILVPNHASFESVFVKCFLAPNGSRHPHACVKCDSKNPANRLAIRLRFTSKSTGREEEMWAALGGKKDFMKVNSLVDFLEGKSDDYTEKQPLRFLPRSATKGRMPVTYTPDF